MDKQNVVYPHNEILLSYKKEWSSDICTMCMNHENIMLSEWNQSQKATYDSTDRQFPEEANLEKHKVAVA